MKPAASEPVRDDTELALADYQLYEALNLLKGLDLLKGRGNAD